MVRLQRRNIVTGVQRDVLLEVCALGAFVLGACASAGSGGPPDAGGGGSGTTDGAIDAPPDAALMTCAGPDTCQAPMMLGTVSGDSGNLKLPASGYRSAWYRVRVTEDSSSIG